MCAYIKDKWLDLAIQLLVTILGVYLGYLAGNAQATHAWEKQVSADTEDQRLGATRRLEMVRREAEHNYYLALKLRELSAEKQSRTVSFEALHFDALDAALSDTDVFQEISAVTASLLHTYSHSGRLLEELRSSYVEAAASQSYAGQRWDSGMLNRHLDSLRYNAAVVAATCFVVNESILPLTKPKYSDDPAFKKKLREGEKRLREVTQGILDGRHEPTRKDGRVTPGKATP